MLAKFIILVRDRSYKYQKWKGEMKSVVLD